MTDSKVLALAYVPFCRFLFQEQCSTGPAVRHQHGRDVSPYDTMPPDCIIIADPGDPAEMEEAERLNRRVMRRALA
jgi:hypothetical protein